MNTEQNVIVVSEAVKEKSKGALFKEKFGYSKTLSRNMKRAGITDVATYKIARKSRKKAEHKVQRKKLEANQLWRRMNPRKKKSKKGGKKAPEQKGTTPITPTA